ncbi:hypothetical protein IM700_008860 [Paenibacillus sp. DXFW5]|uniref:Uncharacterized protein n=1 Tax=Paenibacillus rhizolycopersici TaxID=2780073 RepID=A0ABS2H4R9_9BACL|nr:hypothetical protein [Paenibacillus rhizolycopersici]MBM6995776.1 hypothetical protein [Paenibacillus rhizolycopersici]
MVYMDFINRLNELINEGNSLKATAEDDGYMGFIVVDSSWFKAWQAKSQQCLKELLEEDSYYLKSFNDHVSDVYESHVVNGIKLLESIRDEAQVGRILAKKASKVLEPIDNLGNIFNKFHRVAKQLRSRHSERPTLDITDEYDVQDLLHSIMHLHFDDIRAEEWTPSYAGGGSRVDFILKNEKIVVEVKRSRKSMKAKDLGEQLIIDIQRYKVHPDCKTLLCFVYDPEGYIANPRGIENDLNNKTDNMPVHVFIRPE